VLLIPQDGLWIVDGAPWLQAIIQDMDQRLAVADIALKFHRTLAEAVVQVAKRVGEKNILLTGGCFQNKLLSEEVYTRLQQQGFCVYRHRRVPPNDGGLALGQAGVGAARERRQPSCV
jgi:hydrogenase maturation protein HypF